MDIPSELEISGILTESCEDLSDRQVACWNNFCCTPQLWGLQEGNPAYGLFWVVGQVYGRCIYYNHLEGGYDISEFDKTGVINRYGASQFELSHVVEILGLN